VRRRERGTERAKRESIWIHTCTAKILPSFVAAYTCVCAFYKEREKDREKRKKGDDDLLDKYERETRCEDDAMVDKTRQRHKKQRGCETKKCNLHHARLGVFEKLPLDRRCHVHLPPCTIEEVKTGREREGEGERE
jgi:hypothetical protein